MWQGVPEEESEDPSAGSTHEGALPTSNAIHGFQARVDPEENIVEQDEVDTCSLNSLFSGF